MLPSRLDFLKAIANGADRRRLVEIFGWRAVNPLLKEERRRGAIEVRGNSVELTEAGRHEFFAQKRK